MKKTLKRITAVFALCLIITMTISSCSLIRSLRSLLDGDGEDPGSPFATEGEVDVQKVKLNDLKGKWVDVNSSTTIEFRGDTLTVRFGEWKESYKIVLEKTEYSTTIKAKEGYLGEMSEISVNKDGSLTAYAMILDGPSRQYRFVRENALAAETEIQDLSKDEPKTIESREIINNLASTFHGTGYYLNTPIYMDNAFARSQLLNDPNVREVTELMTRCDLIITGLGGIDVSRLKTAEMIREYQTEAQAKELQAKGAVGCVCMLYYDINGNYVDCEWNEKCICMPLEDVKKNPMTVAVAVGDYKVSSILGALRGGIPNVLITDVTTATKVLMKNEELNKEAQ